LGSVSDASVMLWLILA